MKQKNMINNTFIIEVLIMMICPIPYCDWYIESDAKKGI